MKKTPFFSIIMATYNRAGLLKRALDSLLEQEEQDFEVIMIDDGSEDRTEEVVQPYLKALATRYIFQKNQGFIRAKNHGISLCKGKYITFLDSDDEYKPEHLKSRKKILMENPDLDLLHGGVEVIGSAYVPDKNNPNRQIHLSECAIAGTFFLSRNAIKVQKEFRGTPLSVDAEFMERAIKNKLLIYKTDLPTYVYHRDLESSITLDMMR